MIHFQCDYAEGAHPAILKKMEETNFEQTVGYGADHHCEAAREKIRKACGRQDVDVHFLVGGTQANLTVISAILRPHQGAVAAVSGHINIHETGAVEATGHKVLALPSKDGKITAQQVRDYYNVHWGDETHEHMVQPGMVYISHPTENGTLYSKAELTALKEACTECGLPLFLDGARLGYGLTSPKTDVTLEDITELTDIFYIGGTKVGALFGEAVVIVNPALKKDFRYLIKQHGGMLAKGRLLGIQFEVLFEDGLYYEIARQADVQAMRLRDAFEKKGYSLRYDAYANQQFPIIPNEHLDKLREKYSFSFWEAMDDSRSAVRFCTSWATTEAAIDALIADIEAL